MTGMTDNASNSWGWGWSGANLTSSQDPVEQAAGVSDTVGYTNTIRPNFPTSFTDASGNTVTMAPNSYGQVVSVTPPAGAPTGTSTIAYYPTSSTAPTSGYAQSVTDGNGDQITFDNYDAMGDLTQVSTYPTHGNTTTKNTSYLAYDAAQRVTKATRPDGQYTTLNYNPTTGVLDSVVGPDGKQVNYSYCSNCGALTGVSQGSWSVSWTLDTNKKLMAFTDPNSHTTQYTYGPAEELTKVTYPDNTTLSMTYDQYMLPHVLTNGRGQTVTLGHDANERIVWASPSVGAGSNFTYYPDGALHAATNNAVGGGEYVYLPNGWLSSVSYNYAAGGLTNRQNLIYTYYPDGLRHTVTWKNNSTVVGTWTYGYDLGGRLTGLTAAFGTTSEATSWGYDGEGKLTSQTNANGTSTTLGYNPSLGWLTSVQHNLSASILAQYSLTYDNGSNTVGNVTAESETVGGGPASNSYVYDANYRLTNTTRVTGAQTLHTYTYDQAGNRTYADGVSTTFDSANKIVGLSYDADGNQLTGSYTWDIYSKLTAKPGFSYDYDVRGLRVTSTVSGTGAKTFYVFDGVTLLGEISSTNVPIAAYTWGASGLVSERLLGSNTSFWYHSDAQGNVRQLSNSAGSVVDTYLYDAYGKTVSTVGTDTNPFRYGGQVGYYSDDPTNNASILCGLRWYDPTSGRFLSRDPIQYAGGANLYEYANDNPLKYCDPSGLDAADDVYPENGPYSDVMGDQSGINAGEGFLDFQFQNCPLYNLWTAGAGKDAFGHTLCKGDRMMRGLFGAIPFLSHLGGEGAITRCGCSFVAGTLVQMADGTYKPIERIQAGDLILAKDEATGQLLSQPVEETVHHPADEIVTVTLADAQGKSEQITCTPNHPFYVDGKGWLDAGALAVGTSVSSRRGDVLTVKSVDWQRQENGFTVYNFTVEDVHNYFVGVGAGGAWVHNVRCINGSKAGSVHQGVFYKSNGFPDFNPFKYTQGTNEVQIAYTGSRAGDFAAANRAAGYASTPIGFTWHHHEDMTTMQLVNSAVHDGARHTGGVALWQELTGIRYR